MISKWRQKQKNATLNKFNGSGKARTKDSETGSSCKQDETRRSDVLC